MKYMLIINQGSTPTPSRRRGTASPMRSRRQIGEDYQAVSSTPGVTPGEWLSPPETATTVRVDDGRTLTTDGPFVETKEAIGGYLLLEADDLDAAIELAARIPAARLGGAIEVRPIVDDDRRDGHRAGVPRRVGPRPRCACRLPRRHRPRRGSRAGGVRDRRRALAARGRPRQPRRLVGDDGAQPRDRQDQARPHAGGEGAPARRAAARGGGVRDVDDPR